MRACQRLLLLIALVILIAGIIYFIIKDLGFASRTLEEGILYAI